MAMMTFAVRMQMFGIVHGHAGLQIKSRKLDSVPSVQAKITDRPFDGGRLSLPKLRSTKGRPYVPRHAANRADGRSECGGGLRTHE